MRISWEHDENTLGTYWEQGTNKKNPSHIQPSIIVENPFTISNGRTVLINLHMVTIKLERYNMRTNLNATTWANQLFWPTNQRAVIFSCLCNFQCLYLVHISVDLGPLTLDEVHRTLDEVQLSNRMKMGMNYESCIFSQYIVVSKRLSKTKCLLLIGQS